MSVQVFLEADYRLTKPGIVSVLRNMGAEVTELPDGLEIPGNQRLHGASIDSGTDHRIAMAFSASRSRLTVTWPVNAGSHRHR